MANFTFSDDILFFRILKAKALPDVQPCVENATIQ